MRKLSIILFVFMFLQDQPITMDASKEIATIIDVTREEGFLLEEWQVVVLDKVSKKEFNNITNVLQSSHLGTVTKDENKLIYIFETKKRNDDIDYYIQAIVPSDQTGKVSIQLVITGEKWNDSIHTYYNMLTNRLQKEIPLNFAKLFTCVKLNDNGIIIDGFSIDEIWNKMNVVHVNEHEDNVQQSIYEKEVYGYTTLWNSKITVEKKAVNFHMSIKNDIKNKKQVIIGTPIILNEY